jgi:hypothetical protein
MFKRHVYIMAFEKSRSKERGLKPKLSDEATALTQADTAPS